MYLASRGWRADDGPLLGESFAWAVCLPVLFSFVVIDAVWVAVAVAGLARAGITYAASGAIWVAAIIVDFSHH